MSWTWTVLRAGGFRLDGGGMFGLIPRTIWSKLSPPDELNRIRLQTNCLLLEGHGKRVLVETGYGDKWSDKERSVYDLERRTVVDALGERGVEPEAIDLVVLTHLHFDHAAGLTSGTEHSVQRVFPRATIAVQQTEWEDARAGKSTMTRTYLESHLAPIEAAVQLCRGEEQLLPGLRVTPMPGHTWGQQAVIVETDGGRVCFPGDVMPTIHHAHPAFSMAYDMLPYENMLRKKALLSSAAAERWTLVLDHEPDHPVVSVTEESGRFALTPMQ